jgi:hypothetical protein
VKREGEDGRRRVVYRDSEGVGEIRRRKSK